MFSNLTTLSDAAVAKFVRYWSYFRALHSSVFKATAFSNLATSSSCAVIYFTQSTLKPTAFVSASAASVTFTLSALTSYNGVSTAFNATSALPFKPFQVPSNFANSSLAVLTASSSLSNSAFASFFFYSNPVAPVIVPSTANFASVRSLRVPLSPSPTSFICLIISFILATFYVTSLNALSLVTTFFFAVSKSVTFL